MTPDLLWYGWLLVAVLMIGALINITEGAIRYAAPKADGWNVAIGVFQLLIVFVWLVFFP